MAKQSGRKHQQRGAAAQGQGAGPGRAAGAGHCGHQQPGLPLRHIPAPF
jgi:hypothetical protein